MANYRIKVERLNEEMRQSAIISGMEKALAAEKELYGEQIATQKLAEAEIAMAEQGKKANTDKIDASAVAYAKEILRLNAEGANFFMDDRLGSMLANAEKTVKTGEADSISDLIEALENYYSWNDTKEEDTIWGQSDQDLIINPQMMESLGTNT